MTGTRVPVMKSPSSCATGRRLSPTQPAKDCTAGTTVPVMKSPKACSAGTPVPWNQPANAARRGTTFVEIHSTAVPIDDARFAANTST